MHCCSRRCTAPQDAPHELRARTVRTLDRVIKYGFEPLERHQREFMEDFLVALPTVEKPGKIGMQAFIMTHDPRFKVIKSREYREDDDPRKNCYFICDCR